MSIANYSPVTPFHHNHLGKHVPSSVKHWCRSTIKTSRRSVAGSRYGRCSADKCGQTLDLQIHVKYDRCNNCESRGSNEICDSSLGLAQYDAAHLAFRVESVRPSQCCLRPCCNAGWSLRRTDCFPVFVVNFSLCNVHVESILLPHGSDCG